MLWRRKCVVVSLLFVSCVNEVVDRESYLICVMGDMM
jgi:hypothetical protein